MIFYTWWFFCMYDSVWLVGGIHNHWHQWMKFTWCAGYSKILKRYAAGRGLLATSQLDDVGSACSITRRHYLHHQLLCRLKQSTLSIQLRVSHMPHAQRDDVDERRRKGSCWPKIYFQLADVLQKLTCSSGSHILSAGAFGPINSTKQNKINYLRLMFF